MGSHRGSDVSRETEKQLGLRRPYDLDHVDQSEKDAAFKVIATIMSDDFVDKMMRSGLMTTLKTQKFLPDFAKDLKLPADIDLNPIFATVPAPIVYESPIWPKETNMVEDLFFNSVVTGQMDVNTALRQAQDQIDKALAQEASK